MLAYGLASLLLACAPDFHLQPPQDDGGVEPDGEVDGGTDAGSDGGSGDGGQAADTLPATALLDGGLVAEEFSRAIDPGPTTRVLAVDQGQDDQVSVLYDLDEPTHLVLLDGSPVQWKVTETHPGSVLSVLADCDGVEPRAEAPDGVPVSCAPTGTPGNARTWMDIETRILELWLEDLGHPALASIHHADQAGEITLVQADAFTDDPSLPDCDSGIEPVTFQAADTSWVSAACPDLAADQNVCATVAGPDVLLLGVDSGRSCAVRPNPLPTDSSGAGRNFAWFDGSLFVPGRDGAVTELPLQGSDYKQSFTYSAGVAMDGDRMLVRFDGEHGAARFWDAEQLYGYDSMLALQCDPGTAVETRPGWRETMAFTVTDSLYIDAWEFGDQVDVSARGSGQALGALHLGGLEGTINGLAIVEGDLLVLWGDEDFRLSRHDLSTGQVMRQHVLPERMIGLACAPLGPG